MTAYDDQQQHEQGASRSQEVGYQRKSFHGAHSRKQSTSGESSHHLITSSESSLFASSPRPHQFRSGSLVARVTSHVVAFDSGLVPSDTAMRRIERRRILRRQQQEPSGQMPSSGGIGAPAASACPTACSTLPWRDCQCLRPQTTAPLSLSSNLSQFSSPATCCPVLASISSSSVQTLSAICSSEQTVQITDDSHCKASQSSRHQQWGPNAMSFLALHWSKKALYPLNCWPPFQSTSRFLFVLALTFAVFFQIALCDTQPTLFTEYTSTVSEEPRPNRSQTLMQWNQMNRKIRQPINSLNQFCAEPPLVPNAISSLQRNQKHHVFPLGQEATYMCVQGYKAKGGVSVSQCSYLSPGPETTSPPSGSHVHFPDSFKSDADSEHHVVLLVSGRSKNSKRLVSDLDEEPNANANGPKSVIFTNNFVEKRKMSRKTDDDLLGSVYDTSAVTNLDGRNSDLDNDEFLVKSKQKMEKSIQTSRPVWLPTVTLECRPVTCPDPGQVEHATLRTNASSLAEFTFNSNVHYVCEEGYETVGIPFLTCNANGNWNRLPPKCHLKQCPSLPALENGRILYTNERRTDSRAEYHCDNGFRLNALTNFRHCRTDDLWSSLEAANIASNLHNSNGTEVAYRCVPVECPQPPRPHAGVRILNLGRRRKTYSPGDVIIYACDSVKVRATSKCRPDGEWSREPPHCPEVTPKCPPLPHFPHGLMNLEQTKANFTCFEGFVLDGPSTITCLQNGAWSGPIPNCTVVTKEAGEETFGNNYAIEQEQKKSSRKLTMLLIVIAIVATVVFSFAGWFVCRIRRDKLQRKKWRQYFGHYQHRQSKTHIVMSNTHGNNLNAPTGGISSAAAHGYPTGNAAALNGASRQLLQRARTDSNSTNHQAGSFLQSSFSSSDDNAVEGKSFHTGTISSEHARTVSSYAEDTCPEDEFEEDDEDIYSNSSILRHKGLVPSSPPVAATRRMNAPITHVKPESTPMMLISPSVTSSPASELSTGREHIYSNVPHATTSAPFSGPLFPPPPSRKSNVPVTEL